MLDENPELVKQKSVLKTPQFTFLFKSIQGLENPTNFIRILSRKD